MGVIVYTLYKTVSILGDVLSMCKKPSLVLFLVCTLLSFNGLVYGESGQVLVLTEDHKPYSYAEQGKVVGSATEIVRKVLDRANLGYTIQLLPWARAFHTASSMDNALIYPITRTKEREASFHWIGEVVPPSIWHLYKLKSRQDIQLTNLEQAKQYLISVNRNSDKHTFLQKAGFQKLDLAHDQVVLINLLMYERSDLVLLNAHTMSAYLSAAAKVAEIESALTVKESYGYMALSKKTALEVVDKVRNAYNSLLLSNDIQPGFRKEP